MSADKNKNDYRLSDSPSPKGGRPRNWPKLGEGATTKTAKRSTVECLANHKALMLKISKLCAWGEWSKAASLITQQIDQSSSKSREASATKQKLRS